MDRKFYERQVPDLRRTSKLPLVYGTPHLLVHGPVQSIGTVKATLIFTFLVFQSQRCSEIKQHVIEMVYFFFNLAFGASSKFVGLTNKLYISAPWHISNKWNPTILDYWEHSWVDVNAQTLAGNDHMLPYKNALWSGLLAGRFSIKKKFGHSFHFMYI